MSKAAGPASAITKQQVAAKKQAAKQAAKEAKRAIKLAADAEKHVDHLTEFSTPYQKNCKPDKILAAAEKKADELEAAADAAMHKAETLQEEAKAAQAAYRAANPGFFGKLFGATGSGKVAPASACGGGGGGGGGGGCDGRRGPWSWGAYWGTFRRLHHM